MPDEDHQHLASRLHACKAMAAQPLGNAQVKLSPRVTMIFLAAFAEQPLSSWNSGKLGLF